MSAAFCDDWLDALYGGTPADPAVAAAVRQPGFAVYRNTVLKACVDALAANFPAVLRLTGEAWFLAEAAAFARTTPPSSPSLLDYGAAFPAYLAAHSARHGLPYLPHVAALERLWMECHRAAEAPLLAASALAALAPERLGLATLAPHPAARWYWCADLPAVSICRANRDPESTPATPAWEGEGALLTRPEGAVQWLPIGPGAAAFLDRCARQLPLQEAAAAALAAEPALDLSAMLAALLGAGSFQSFHPG